MAYADHDDRMDNGNMARRTTKDYRRYGNIIGSYGDRRRTVPPGLAKKPGRMPPGQYKKLRRDGYFVSGPK